MLRMFKAAAKWTALIVMILLGIVAVVPYLPEPLRTWAVMSVFMWRTIP